MGNKQVGVSTRDMINIHIEDKKAFTSGLFIKEVFDGFLLTEASITTFNTYSIDGRIQKKFYTEQEYETLGSPEFSKWCDMKKLCFEMIKGSKTPLKFKIVLKLSETRVEDIIRKTETMLTASDVQGLFVNIRYENDSIDCITATSLKIFSMDKSLEEAFDEYMGKFLLALT